jgi:hypothetical protein
LAGAAPLPGGGVRAGAPGRGDSGALVEGDFIGGVARDIKNPFQILHFIGTSWSGIVFIAFRKRLANRLMNE